MKKMPLWKISQCAKNNCPVDVVVVVAKTVAAALAVADVAVVDCYACCMLLP